MPQHDIYEVAEHSAFQAYLFGMNAMMEAWNTEEGHAKMSRRARDAVAENPALVQEYLDWEAGWAAAGVPG